MPKINSKASNKGTNSMIRACILKICNKNETIIRIMAISAYRGFPFGLKKAINTFSGKHHRILKLFVQPW